MGCGCLVRGLKMLHVPAKKSFASFAFHEEREKHVSWSLYWSECSVYLGYRDARCLNMRP